jgi:hypothetical protein
VKKGAPIKTLFWDTGGVPLTNGWAEMEEHHDLNLDTHEEDKIVFNEYPDRVDFYEKRPFTRAEFRRFMSDIAWTPAQKIACAKPASLGLRNDEGAIHETR